MIYVKVDAEKAIVSVDGAFDIKKGKAVSNELEEAVNRGCTKVIFDFARATFIASSGLGVVVMARRMYGAENVCAINQQGDVLKAFKSANLYEIFKPQQEKG